MARRKNKEDAEKGKENAQIYVILISCEYQT
jgi:hypothetical protein